MDNNGLLYVEADGQTIGMKFGMQAILNIETEKMLSNEAGESISTMVKLAYEGYKYWSFRKKEKPMEFDLFCDFMDDAFMSDPDIFSKVARCLENSKPLAKKPEPTEEKKEDEPAKKIPAQKNTQKKQ